MTKKNSWVCDICKEEFKQGEPGYFDNAGIDITIPASSMGEREEKFHFADTCHNCRVNLSVAINGLIK
jgi:hypothetical protein